MIENCTLKKLITAHPISAYLPDEPLFRLFLKRASSYDKSYEQPRKHAWDIEPLFHNLKRLPGREQIVVAETHGAVDADSLDGADTGSAIKPGCRKIFPYRCRGTLANTSLLIKNVSLHINYMLRQYFLFAPNLA